MIKPTNCMFLCHCLENFSDGVIQCCLRTSSDCPQAFLDLGESKFYWREIWRIGGQEEQGTANRFDGVAHFFAFVSTKVVYHYYLPRTQARAEQLVEIDYECLSVYGTFQGHYRTKPFQCQCCKQAGGLSVVAGYTPIGSLASWGPSITACHSDGCAALVYEYQIFGGDFSNFLAPLFPCYWVLLGSSNNLFFRVQPAFRIALCIAVMLTEMLWLLFHIWQCSSKIASGNSRSWASRAGYWAGAMRAGRPGIGLGTMLPVWRLSVT
jgi:hypothetical protein